VATERAPAITPAPKTVTVETLVKTIHVVRAAAAVYPIRVMVPSAAASFAPVIRSTRRITAQTAHVKMVEPLTVTMPTRPAQTDIVLVAARFSTPHREQNVAVKFVPARPGTRKIRVTAVERVMTAARQTATRSTLRAATDIAPVAAWSTTMGRALNVRAATLIHAKARHGITRTIAMEVARVATRVQPIATHPIPRAVTIIVRGVVPITINRRAMPASAPVVPAVAPRRRSLTVTVPDRAPTVVEQPLAVVTGAHQTLAPVVARPTVSAATPVVIIERALAASALIDRAAAESVMAAMRGTAMASRVSVVAALNARATVVDGIAIPNTVQAHCAVVARLTSTTNASGTANVGTVRVLIAEFRSAFLPILSMLSVSKKIPVA
jgi:hypothetical protein